MNGLGVAAGLVYLGDAAFEIDTGLHRPQHFITGAEDAIEQLELLGQQLIDAPVGVVVAIQEVDDNHIVLLPVAVATPDALFDPLRVPWQVIVDDHRAELEVDPFGTGLGGDHDAAAFASMVAEVVDQRGAGVGSA
jgi:hypothetical protein